MKNSFLIGALGYPILELLYRGRTHYSMALAGGTSSWLIDSIRRLPVRNCFKPLFCGVGITAVEYLCGCIWNSDYKVWDYRKTPLNFRGQICIPYSLLWCAFGGTCIALLDLLEENAKPDR